jgi:outer membrane receptor protein involved in Fe transport
MSRIVKSILLSVVWWYGLTGVASAQEIGGLRGMVSDKDFDVPLAAAQVQIAETGEKRTTDDQGHFVFEQVKPGTYTLTFTKDGYTRYVAANVLVEPGRVVDADAALAGEFVEMEEVVAQDLDLGGNSEVGLLNLRMESPSLMDSIGSQMMTQAGVSDAAAALRLVSGATVEEGKYAVVRGLPDRYVSNQLNGVRLPTADENRRAVQLDQFPTALIQSIQVSKTFMPDQQGDASGGAVNLVLKGIPDQRVLDVKVGTEYNTQAPWGGEFLSYKGGGVSFFGLDDRDIPQDNVFGSTMGTSPADVPFGYNWALTAGGKRELDNGIRVGALASMYYKHDSSFYEGGQYNLYDAQMQNGQYVLVPRVNSGFTSLYDVTQGLDWVQWGALGAVGVEMENHALSLMYMRTQVTEDKATLMEDTRGSRYRESLNIEAPFHRNQTLEYTERSQSTVQLKGQHTLDVLEHDFGSVETLKPQLDWTLAHSEAEMDQPDKRVFSTAWTPGRVIPIPDSPDLVFPAVHTGYDPSGSGNGFAQRIWKDITEQSNQVAVNGRLPFKQWSDQEGYLKVGTFFDRTTREYQQDSFAYDSEGSFEGPWEAFWSDVYVSEGHPIHASDMDVDYSGEQQIFAGYTMADLPLTTFLKIIGGFRYETTDLSITNHPESDNAVYLPPGGTGWTHFGPEADVSFSQGDILPAVAVEITPLKPVKVRGSFSQTVARQTFKELSPVLQMEYLGADVFVGNPQLQMSSLSNYDLRVDYEPYAGSLLSASWFYKDVKDPIEYVQRFQASLDYVTPVNYPKGQLQGLEFEVRQALGKFWSSLEGFSAGANATFIQSEVTLPAEEAAAFAAVGAPTSTRDMMGAPSYLYNLNLTYEHPKYHTQVGAFWTVRGDTLVEGGVALGNSYVPDVYAEAYGTLNLSVMQPVGKHARVTFAAKNLTNPEIREVYRSDFVSGEATKRSFTKGVDLALSLEYEF